MPREKELSRKASFRQKLDKQLKDKKTLPSTSGYEFQPLYTPEDTPGADYEERLGYPGEFPFTRGVQASMYRGRFWTMRQYAGFGTASESNERYRYLIEKGQTGLSVAFDLPTQMGYDSDDPVSAGEVGKVGVAVDSLEDMEVLLKGIPLDKVSTSMTINSTAFVLLSLYLAVAEKQGVPFSSLSGTIQNDILKEYIARGTYVFPPKPSLRLITDIFEFAGGNVPKWNTISISGYHIREAGASAVQEIAFTFLNGMTYVRAAMDAGLEVDAFGERLSFFFNAHNNLLEEVAKFRAARRLWAKIMHDKFNAVNPKAQMLRFHTQTAGCTLTAQQPEVNVARVTLQALAAVLGGTQSLHTNSKDEALGLPTMESATVALRTQQAIAFESGVTDMIDPLGGSYAIETLTDRIESEAMRIIEEIEAGGGMVDAIEKGIVQRQIEDSSYSYQKEIEAGERIIVGVNSFSESSETPIPVLRIDPKLETEQVGRLRDLKARRDNAAVSRALANVKAAAESSDNIMPPTLEAVKAYATIGEIVGTLRDVFGVFRAG
ncbi:MAG TPA: methylmalonyl-CoA mutase family protein [Acidobacteriota bacterium]|nr:methylmalonyl-CoA mutase family protein [Acidobacteriota bacterium]HQO19049.1 methylmalonyl-CoA mutase family protein [Acidobacteriota bacterium]HQQ45942.1 methylmalonyl-CoA mutase family protein [Acidobacteriota bacterium]